MKEYRFYSVEEFVWDDNFRRWVLAPDVEADVQWERWLAENPEKAELIMKARELVLAISPRNTPMPEPEKEAALNCIMDHFDEQFLVGDRTATAFPVWLKVACCLVLLAGFSWLFIKYNASKHWTYERLVSASDARLQEVRNTAGAPMLVKMSDGTRITLDPGSRLSYPRQFSGDKREVYLSGSAFFDVVRNPASPFYVYADEVVTKVLGTSFKVRSFEREPEVSVAVKSGRVAVYTRTDELAQTPASELSAVVIVPNQQLLVARETIKMKKILVPDPVPVVAAPQLPNFNFSDIPVSDIFKTLQNAYGIEVLFDEKSMKNCPVTAALGDLPLFEKLDLICNAVGARYEVIDGRINITGGGCQEND